MCVFARCLSTILEAKGKRIGSLHTVVVEDSPTRLLRIPPLQIARLQKASLGDCSFSVTLNPYQLEAVQRKFSLSDEEMRQLKIALLAESEFRLLLDRIPTDQALQIAQGLFQMLLDAGDDVLDTYGVDLGNVRHIDEETLEDVLDDMSSPLAVLDQRYCDELEPVAQAHDEAVLWLSRAGAVNDAGRKQLYTGLAASLLAQAAKTLTNVSLHREALPLVQGWSDLYR